MHLSDGSYCGQLGSFLAVAGEPGLQPRNGLRICPLSRASNNAMVCASVRWECAEHGKAVVHAIKHLDDTHPNCRCLARVGLDSLSATPSVHQCPCTGHVHCAVMMLGSGGPSLRAAETASSAERRSRNGMNSTEEWLSVCPVL